MKFHLIVGGLVLGVASTLAAAHDYKLGKIAIGHPYARVTSTGQTTGGGYLSLDNRGDADRLVSVSADVSKSIEMHTMKMEGNVMRMSQLDAIELPAGKVVELKPGGYHIMFVGLKAPLKAGDSFPMTLKFEKAGEVKVDVKVEAADAKGGGHDMKH